MKTQSSLSILLTHGNRSSVCAGSNRSVLVVFWKILVEPQKGRHAEWLYEIRWNVARILLCDLRDHRGLRRRFPYCCFRVPRMSLWTRNRKRNSSRSLRTDHGNTGWTTWTTSPWLLVRATSEQLLVSFIRAVPILEHELVSSLRQRFPRHHTIINSLDSFQRFEKKLHLHWSAFVETSHSRFKIASVSKWHAFT